MQKTKEASDLKKLCVECCADSTPRGNKFRRYTCLQYLNMYVFKEIWKNSFRMFLIVARYTRVPLCKVSLLADKTLFRLPLAAGMQINPKSAINFSNLNTVTSAKVAFRPRSASVNTTDSVANVRLSVSSPN
jgi:hypothetical protein